MTVKVLIIFVYIEGWTNDPVLHVPRVRYPGNRGHNANHWLRRRHLTLKSYNQVCTESCAHLDLFIQVNIGKYLTY